MPTISDSPTGVSDDLESLTDEQAGDEGDGEEVEEEIVKEDDEPEEGGEEEYEVEEVVEEEEEEDAAEVEEGEEDEEEAEAEAEVMEVEEEEEEEEEEEVVVEMVEEEDEEECEAGDDFPDKNAMESSEEIEHEELAGGPESVSCTHDRSNSNPTTITHEQDGNRDSLTAFDPSDDSESEAQLTKETPKETSKDAKETQEGQTYLTLKDSVVDENIISDPHEGIDVGSENVKPDDVVEKEAPTSQKITDLQILKDSSLSSMQTPQRRPRSSSPGATVEDAKKRPALICTFFASGWCIKGKSCRFLHQKEELLNTNLQKKGDLAGPSREGDSLDGTGSREEAERQKLSASEELLDSSHADSSLKSPLTLQKSLFRTYGGENLGLPKSSNDHSMHEANPQSGLESYPSKNEFRQTLVQEEYRRPFGVNIKFAASDQRQSTPDDSLTRRYQDDGKLFKEPRVDSLNDSQFTRNTLVPEYRYHSGGSSTLTSLYSNSNNYLSYAEKTDELFSRSQQSHFPPIDSYTSCSLTSSLNSGLNSPLQPVRNSPSVHAFAQAGTLSTRGSAPLSTEHLDSRSTSVFDRGYDGSRSASLPRNSSPYYFRNEVENKLQPNVPRDLPAFAGQRTQVQDAWAPSVPFRSSFCNAPPNMSTSGSKYDPLLDSIEPPKIANITFQSSERISIHNVASQHMNGDPLISGSHTPGYNTQNYLNSFRQANEGALGEDTSGHELSWFTAAVTTPVPSTSDRVNSSLPKEDKHWIPGHAIDGANVDVANPNGPDGSQRSIEDKGRNNKESKAMKFFRAALVDFIKELVKPFWREGHLSKDAHKMIVKKAVEKVLSAIQPHQVPSASDSVNQYLSTSRAKLLKLVEGYVDKYIKSGAS